MPTISGCSPFIGGGLIKNDYEDFLGTGQPLKSEDDLRAIATRYLYRVWDDWFVGLQGVYTNYQILGQNSLDDQILNTPGLTGFKSGGIGAVVMHDSRDNENSPSKGWVMNFNNIAYRELARRGAGPMPPCCCGLTEAGIRFLTPGI
jgi:hypothetical protein